MRKIVSPKKSATQEFRDLAVGESLKMLCTHYQSPHSTARAAGIRVETEVLHRNTTGKILMKVTRIANEPTTKRKASK